MELHSIQDAVGDITNALFFLPKWAVGVLILGLAVVLGLAVHVALRRLARRAFGSQPVVASLLAQTRGLTRLAFVTVALALVLPAISLPADLAAWIAAILRVAFWVLMGWIALTAVDVSVTLYLLRFRLDSADNLLARKHVTQMRILKRTISTLVIVVTVAAVLMSFSEVRQVGISLFASAGVAGIVAGLAARPVLANLIAGVQLAVTQPIRLEDTVVVENEWGSIEEITSTYVVVRLWDLRRLVVPLSYFIEKPFQNWTREGAAIMGTVLLHLDYTAPIEQIRAKAAELAAASRFWNRQVVSVQVTDATAQTIEVRVLMSADNASDAFNLRCEMREKLIGFLQAEWPQALPRGRNETVVPGAPNRSAAEPASPPRAVGARV